MPSRFLKNSLSLLPFRKIFKFHSSFLVLRLLSCGFGRIPSMCAYGAQRLTLGDLLHPSPPYFSQNLKHAVAASWMVGQRLSPFPSVSPVVGLQAHPIMPRFHMDVEYPLVVMLVQCVRKSSIH